MANEWISYHNQNAIRNQPLSTELVDAMSFLPDMGVTMRVASGGETPDRKASNSGRHLHGNAADVDFYAGDRLLDWNNKDDLPILSNIVAQARANGVTGIGAGDDYMGAGRFHIGFGAPAVWGAGGRSANAPEWLVSAYNSRPTPFNSATAAIDSAAPQSGASLWSNPLGYVQSVAQNIAAPTPQAAATPRINVPPMTGAIPATISPLGMLPAGIRTLSGLGGLWSNPAGTIKTAMAPMVGNVAAMASDPRIRQAAIGPLMGSLAGRNVLTRGLMNMNIGSTPTINPGATGQGTRAMAVSSQGASPVMMASTSGSGAASSGAHGNWNPDVYRANTAVLGSGGHNQASINNALAQGKTLYKLA